MNSFATLSTVLVLVTSSAAAAEEMKMHMPQRTGIHHQESESKIDAGFSKALKQSMAKMMSDMDVRSTGNPDEDFVIMMMPHHQSAVDMAKVELQYGTDPTLRRLAEDIVVSQGKEISIMKDWRANHDK